MKEVHPEYADKVDFYLVGTDRGEGKERLESYRDAQGYPWPIGLTERDTLENLRVFTQSTKIAFDKNGIITYRDGYGQGNPEIWRNVFSELSSQ